MDPNIVELRTSVTQKINSAKALRDQYTGRIHEMPEEVSKQIDGILGEADVLRVRLETLERLEKGIDSIESGSGSLAASLSWREAGPNEGNAETDEKSWRSFDVPTVLGVKTFRYQVPLSISKDAKTEKAYSDVFQGYMRKGHQGLSSRDLKTLTEGVDNSGGFFVPADLQSDVMKKTATQAVFRRLARVIQTTRDLVQFPRYVYDTDDKYTSAVRMTWTGESPSSSTVHRVTETVAGLMDIPVHTAMASFPISNNLLEDAAFDIESMSSDFLAEAFSLGEDDIFLNGTGVGQPMGLLTEVNGNGPAYVASGASAAISTSGDAYSAARLVKMYYTLPSQYRARATWLMASGTMEEVEALVDAQKRPLVASLIAGSLMMGQPEIIKGRPVEVDEFMPAIAANAYPIIFGDFNGYTIVDRVGFSVQRLAEIYAELNLIVLLARKRVGGYCTEPHKIKVLKAAAS